MTRIAPDFEDRARPIRLLVLDVDGVLTDGRIYIDIEGRQSLAFDFHDGHGIRMAQRAEDFQVALLTARENPIVEIRAKMLEISHYILGARTKLPALQDLLQRTGIAFEETAYMGDDVIDLPVLRRVGLPLAPAGAVAEVREVAALVTERKGGRGAVREALEAILRAQKKWDGLMARYLE